LRLRQDPIVGTTIRQSSAPARAIPDNNAAGITDTINIAAAAVIGTLKITLDITHTFIGDLNVSLQTPAGTSVALHQRTGGSTDNLIQRYTFTNTPALQTLRGQPIQGAWRLRIADLEAQDVGKLNQWGVKITRQT
jgi:subtilisin-like proprotein convertase family protein